MVYKICCSVCDGQTGRTLTQRLKEHQRSVKNNDTQSSALAEHSSQTGHRIDWDGVSVLGHQPNLRQRCLLESWFIHLYSGRSINRERGSLPHSYILLQRSSGGGAPRLTPAQSSLTTQSPT